MRKGSSSISVFMIIVALLSLSLSAWFSCYTILRDYRIESRDFDLGVLSNVIINTAYGDIFRSSYYLGDSFLGVHVVPLYLLLGFLYRLFPFIETLLIAQSTALFFAAIPLYFFAAKLQIPRWAAFLIAVLFLLHPGNHEAVFYDFHELAFFPLAFFLYALALSNKRPALSLLALAFCLAVKEDISLIVLFSLPMLSGLFTDKKQLWTHAEVCIVWYLITVLIRAEFAGTAHRYVWYYKDLAAAGHEGLYGLILGILQNPLYLIKSRFTADRALYIFQLLAPVAFAPLLSLRFLSAILPGFVLTLLSSNEKKELFTLSFQYVWYIIPASFIALSLAAERFHSGRIYLLSLAAILTLILTYQYGALFKPSDFKGGYRTVKFEMSPADWELRSNIQRLASKIPLDDWVVCSSDLCPQIYDHPNVLPCRAWDHKEHRFIEWAFISDDRNCSRHGLEQQEFKLVDEVGKYSLWRRGD